MFAKLDASLSAISRLVAGGAVALAALLVGSEWLYRQVAGRNLLHEWLEPAQLLLAVAGMFAVTAIAGRPAGAEGGLRWLRLAGLFVLAAGLAGGLALLDLAAARSIFYPNWSLRLPLYGFAFAAGLAALRALFRVLPQVSDRSAR